MPIPIENGPHIGDLRFMRSVLFSERQNLRSANRCAFPIPVSGHHHSPGLIPERPAPSDWLSPCSTISSAPAGARFHCIRDSGGSRHRLISHAPIGAKTANLAMGRLTC
jgi:hypothetical protein